MIKKLILLLFFTSAAFGYMPPITIYANASSNFEMRTPATSGETINGQDADGTKEYLITNGDVVICRCVSATGWICTSFKSTDGDARAVTPD